MSQFYEYIKMALSNIKANKMRSFLTMLGIIIGISSVILVMGLGNGAKNVITDELSGIGAGQICIYTNDNTGTYDITNNDIEVIKKDVDGIKAVKSQYYESGTTHTIKGDFKVEAYGTMPEDEYFNNNGLSAGRYFNEQEYQAGTPVCIIPQADALRIFGSTDILGMELDATLWGVEVPFTIIGIEAPAKSALSFTYENSPIQITFPITVFNQVYGMEIDSYSQIYILAQDNANTYDIATQASNLLASRHNCANTEDPIYQVENFSDYMTMANTIVGMVTALITLIAAISLVVGGIGVMNIMLVSVTERTREIGIRKALGARTRSIMVQFLSESAIITLIGGAIGIVLGILFAYGVAAIVGMVNSSLSFTPAISAVSVIVASAFSCGIGLFFGIYPAKKAAKLSPIEALRSL